MMIATTKRQIFPRVLVVGLALSLSACTNPYDPVQRTIGGGLIGAGSGAVGVFAGSTEMSWSCAFAGALGAA